MRKLAALCGLAALAACDAPVNDSVDPLDQISQTMAMPVSTEEMSDRDRVIAGIEAAGCVIVPDNADEVFNSIGLPEADYRRIGAELVADGLADVSTVGVYRLETAPCAI